MKKIHLIMPMGGRGTRFGNSRFEMPKPLIALCGKPMFYWAVQSVVKFAAVEDMWFIVLKEHVMDFQIDEVIRQLYPDAKICVIPEVLNGAVLTCREGVRGINDDLPVMFNDCDHAFISGKFYEYANAGMFEKTDGALMIFESDNPNYSYVLFDDNGDVAGTKEKMVISNQAICGAYYFRNKEIFENAVNAYLKDCSYSEYFMSGVYDELIKSSKKVITFPVTEHISFGTPEEYSAAEKDERLKMFGSV